MKEQEKEHLKILEEHFKKGMINKDFESFKRTHLTLLKCVLKSMDELDNKHTPPTVSEQDIKLACKNSKGRATGEGWKHQRFGFMLGAKWMGEQKGIELTKQPSGTDGWISIKNNPPEIGQDVWVWSDLTSDGEIANCVWSKEMGKYHELNSIIYWMPCKKPNAPSKGMRGETLL